MKFKFDQNTNDNFLKNAKIAIVVGYFYQDIAENLLNAAQKILAQYGAQKDNINVFYAPGAFEIPLLVKLIAKESEQLTRSSNSNIATCGIITLGAVIKGETSHFDFVCNECARGVANVSYQYEIPIAFGVLTVDNIKQAIDRSGGQKSNKGEEVAMAMIEMLYLKKYTNH